MPSAPRLIFPFLGPIYRAIAPLTEPLIRVMAGGALAIHGYPILFGDIATSAKFFQSLGFRAGPGNLHRTISGISA